MPIYNTYPGVDEDYLFPPPVRQAIAASPEIASTISNKLTTEVGGAVAEVISQDPTVVQAAKDAVNGVLGGRLDDLESEVRLNVPHTLNVDDPLYSAIGVTWDYRRVSGTLKSGGQVGLVPGKSESILVTGNGYVNVTLDYRREQPDSDSSGLTPDYILDEWSSRMSVSGKMTGLLSIGDSMTMDYQNKGLAVAEELAKELGVQAFNQGYSGETPLQLAWRLGSAEVRIAVDAGVIPASGSVNATIEPSIGWFRGATFECQLVDIEGSSQRVYLTQSTSAGPSAAPTWTVRQVTGSAPIRILSGSRIMPLTGLNMDMLTSPLAIWFGRNDPDLTRVIDNLKGVISQHRDPLERRLVRPIFNNINESVGTTGYDNIMTINSAIKNVAGLDYYDDRAALIEHGLEIAQITPTSNDITAITQDRIPPSLMMDGTHLSVVGRKALVRLDAIEIKARNWFSN